MKVKRAGAKKTVHVVLKGREGPASKKAKKDKVKYIKIPQQAAEGAPPAAGDGDVDVDGAPLPNITEHQRSQRLHVSAPPMSSGSGRRRSWLHGSGTIQSCMTRRMNSIPKQH